VQAEHLAAKHVTCSAGLFGGLLLHVPESKESLGYDIQLAMFPQPRNQADPGVAIAKIETVFAQVGNAIQRPSLDTLSALAPGVGAPSIEHSQKRLKPIRAASAHQLYATLQYTVDHLSNRSLFRGWYRPGAQDVI
jgi:hypothetical protein